MKSTLMKLWLGASIIAGMSAIATAPAVAGSLTGATLIGSDYYKIASDGTETYIDQNAILSTILQGDASNPGGNVELFASSETVSNSDFATYTDVTSLTGEIGGNFISYQMSSDEQGTLESHLVRVQGIFYGRVAGDA